MINQDNKQSKSVSGINERIVKVIVDKLGYTYVEVKKQVLNAI